jgi:hypothetical protein
MRTPVHLLLAFGLLAASPSLARAALTVSRDDESVRLEVGRHSAQLRLRGRNLSGGGVDLTNDAKGIHGHAYGVAIDLALDKGRISGQLGRAPVQVSVQQLGAGIDLEGALGENPVNLTVQPTRIGGVLGECTYALGLAGEEYRGWRDCGGPPVPLRTLLRLPAAVGAWSDAEQAALLLALLSASPLPPALVTRAAGPGPWTQEALLSQFGLAVATEDSQGGLRITRVVALSPAAAAGLDEGMIITHVGYEDVQNIDSLLRALRRLNPGSTVVLQLQSSGGDARFMVSLQAPNPAEQPLTGEIP